MPSEKRFFIWIFLLLSFCSFGYELVLLYTITPTIQNDLLGQTLTIGIFILGLGLGGFLGSRGSSWSPLKIFIWVELVLSFLGATCPLLLESQFTAFTLFRWDTDQTWLLTSQILTLCIGTLSGLELPLIHRLLRRHSSEEAWHWLIGFTYLGAFFATMLLPYILIPHIGVVNVAFFLGALNLTVAGVFCIRYRQMSLPWAVDALLIGLAFLFSVSWQSWLLKFSYSPVQISAFDSQNFHNLRQIIAKTSAVERIVSKYQTIDIVESPRFKNEFILFLNHRVQFHSHSQKFYHEWMAHVPIAAYVNKLERVLILGGGDGLLAAQLLRHPSIISIDMIELDPEMLRLANEHPKFLRINEGALKNSKVRVTPGDAYNYVRNHRGDFDAIFIDLPYPYTQELARLFSKEFYSAVLKNLNSQGFVVLDFPVVMDSSTGDYAPVDVLQATLSNLGIKTLFAFGRNESFVAFAANGQPANVEQAFSSEFLSTDARTQLNNLTMYFQDATDPQLVNSVFKPVAFNIERGLIW